MMRHPTQKALWRYAAGEIASYRRQSIREHARQCAVCGSDLRRAIIATRALCGKSDAEPTNGELEAWGEEMLCRWSKNKPWHHRRPAMLAAFAAAAAGLILATLPARHPTDQLVARTGPSEASLALRVLCVTDASPVVIEDATAGCPTGAYLKIMVGRGRSTRRRAAVLLVQEGKPEALYPSALGKPLLTLPTSIEPLARTKLIPDDAPATLKVIAFATDDDVIDAQDALLAWASKASAGVYPNLFTRADAAVVTVTVTRSSP